MSELVGHDRAGHGGVARDGCEGRTYVDEEAVPEHARGVVKGDEACVPRGQGEDGGIRSLPRCGWGAWLWPLLATACRVVRHMGRGHRRVRPRYNISLGSPMGEGGIMAKARVERGAMAVMCLYPTSHVMPSLHRSPQ